MGTLNIKNHFITLRYSTENLNLEKIWGRQTSTTFILYSSTSITSIPLCICRMRCLNYTLHAKVGLKKLPKNSEEF